jgi:hypothetical protein
MAAAALVVLVGSRLDGHKTRQLAGVTWKTSAQARTGNPQGAEERDPGSKVCVP